MVVIDNHPISHKGNLMKVLFRLFMGVLLGIVSGLYAPEMVNQLLVSIKVLFGEFLFFMVPLIIFFYVATGVATGEGSNKKALGAIGLSYTSSTLAGLLAVAVGYFVIPMLPIADPAVIQGLTGSSIEPFMFANMIKLPALMGVIPTVVLALVVGLGLHTKAHTLLDVLNDGKDVIDSVLNRIIIPLLPLYIMGVFAQLSASGTVLPTIMLFAPVIGMLLVAQILWVIILFTMTGLVTKRNPIKDIRTMLPAYFTAIGTMSSAATIPVTTRCIKALGIKESTAEFVAPLCATVHLSGFMVAVNLITMTMATLFGVDLSLQVMLFYTLTAGIICIGAPGVPGGGFLAIAGIMVSVAGIPEAAIPLIITLFIAQDSLSTAVNVTGDGAIALLVDK